MAEALLNVMLENLSSLIQDQLIGPTLGADKEMNKLASTFTTIQAVLEDAEQRQLDSEPIRIWLIKLKDLAYEIEDILDECATFVSKSKHKNSKRRRYSLKKLLFRHGIGKRIQQVTEKLDLVAAECDKFHLRKMDFEGPSKIVPTKLMRETGSTLNDVDHVYGREVEKEKLVDILVNQVKDTQGISVLPIVGLGGLGKTTLAQLVYNDPRVVEHFDTKLWVCVSDSFDAKTLIKAMIESATGGGSASNLEHLDSLERRLGDLLSQKRYLLVLDDVWNDDREKWSKLRDVLVCGLAGSSIITTTRTKKVADIMRTLPAHNLEGLSEEHCLLLFNHCAFGPEEEGRFPKLVAIGKQIVKKCGGVPLAAKALGGLLQFQRTEKKWESVEKSKLLDLPQEDALILPALKLSYHHLPLALRQCFAYCAIFPKDFRIQKRELIHLWMGHGYISSNGILEVEDVGEEIWEELILRSLFQNVISNGKFLENVVTMHDLVHDLAQSIMENKAPTAQLQMISTSASNDKIRQVDLKFKEGYAGNAAFPKSRIGKDMDISVILKKYSRLRVLNANSGSVKALPSDIGNLKHLRILNLSHSNIRILPDSLCSLWNLKILNLSYSGELVRFPKNMRKLKNLRHLFLDGCGSLSETPYKVGELTELRRLEKFIVGCNKGSQLEELHCLNLGGNLEIMHLERVENPQDAKKANLAEKHNLRNLSLEWEASKLRGDRDEKVVEQLEPHPNIEILRIRGFSGEHFPNWMVTMAKLVRVEIKESPHLLDLFQLEDLPHLQHLELWNLAVVEYIGRGGDAQISKFPSLRMLRLWRLPNLKGFFKGEAGVMCPNLEQLEVWRCPTLEMPRRSHFKKLEKWDCDSSLCLASIPKLDNLKVFKANFGENMKCIPSESLQFLTNLETLSIWHADDEQCLPVQGLQGLTSLRQLDVLFSKTLTCLPGEWLCHITTLEVLNIYESSTLIELPEEIKYLESLREITLGGLEKMEYIPEALKQLSSLKALRLEWLDALGSMPEWLGDLTNLRTLMINNCRKLESLPCCIQGMLNLEVISVIGSPKLTRRCEKGKGEDWDKIAHIPKLYIGD